MNRDGRFEGTWSSDDPRDAALVRGLNAMVEAINQNRPLNGPGTLIRRSTTGASIRSRTPSSILPAAWPGKVYNTSQGSTGQVQINGGDDSALAFNGVTATVNGNPIDTLLSGPPPAYPQLAVTGNGVIYAYCALPTPGLVSSLVALPIYYQASLPGADSSVPNGYLCLQLATISNYTSGIFTVNNTTNYGYSVLYYCNGILAAY